MRTPTEQYQDEGQSRHLTKGRADGEFTAGRVPADRTVNGVRVALVIIGVAITIPILLAGAELGLAMGLADVIVAIAVGCIILCLIGCLTATIAAQTKLTTYVITQFPFGTKGAKAVNVIVATSLFGWFAITASFFGETVQKAVADLWAVHGDLSLYIASGSLLMVVTAVYGFTAINWLASVIVPILFVALLVLAQATLSTTSWQMLLSYSGAGMGYGEGITAVVGTFVVGAIIMPDYCRYSMDTKHGILAAVLSLGVGLPIILLTTAIPGIASGEKDVIVLMQSLGWGVWVLLLLIFASWTTNTGNIYSNALGLSTIFTKSPQWLIVTVAGILGTLVALLHITDYLVGFLVSLGIIIPPIAGIYIADYFFVHKRFYDVRTLAQESGISYVAFSAWFAASLVSYATAQGYFRLTGIPACDSILVAFAVYVVAKKVGALSVKRSVAEALEKE